MAMAAVFGAASRATFTFIVFAFEITHDYNAILPLMLGCVIADMIAFRYLPSSIMTEKLARRGLKVPEEYEVGALKVVRVGEVMSDRCSADSAGNDGWGIGGAHQRQEDAPDGEQFERQRPTTLPKDFRLSESDGLLKGVVTQGDLLRALETDPQGSMTVLDAGSNAPIVAYPDELAFDAMYRMLQNNIGRLPVVSREDPRKMVGYFNRSSVLSAWSRQMQEEGRARTWLDSQLARRKFASRTR